VAPIPLLHNTRAETAIHHVQEKARQFIWRAFLFAGLVQIKI
jgi:hypothetical protein